MLMGPDKSSERSVFKGHVDYGAGGQYSSQTVQVVVFTVQVQRDAASISDCEVYGEGHPILEIFCIPSSLRQLSVRCPGSSIGRSL